jgi:predicted transcriptional regulator
MKKLKNQLELARVLLAELGSGPCSFSVLEKRVLAKAGTYATVTSLLYFLRDSGFIFKGACENRAPYNISAKGRLLLEALS